MFIDDWKKIDKCCPYCKGTIWYINWESSDGAHEDTKYRCEKCAKEWWSEGADA